jgi:DNA-binding response OmpR family regulator
VGDSRVLVVDDDPDLVQLISGMLEILGYPVVTAANGAEALDAVDRERPALVVLDARMPILDGKGFSKSLKDKGMKIPILVITGAPDARKWAQDIGADGYLAKPFELTDLLETVRRLVVDNQDGASSTTP